MNILIIEDELSAAKRLHKLVSELRPHAHILDSLDTVEASLDWLNKHAAPDLILLDIHLADGSSFEILQQHPLDTPIIFTTAYDEYALQAFKVNSIDYLLKPIKRGELDQALAKYEKQIGTPTAQAVDYQALAKAMQAEQMQYQKRIVLRFRQSIKAIEIDEIAYFFIESRVCLLRTFEGKTYPVDFNLDELEEKLDPQRFFRANRQCIVSIEGIGKMHTYSKSRIKIELKPPADFETVVSSERSARFKKWLSGN